MSGTVVDFRNGRMRGFGISREPAITAIVGHATEPNTVTEHEPERVTATKMVMSLTIRTIWGICYVRQRHDVRCYDEGFYARTVRNGDGSSSETF